MKTINQLGGMEVKETQREREKKKEREKDTKKKEREREKYIGYYRREKCVRAVCQARIP